jgi:hypothetical protein
VACSFPFHANEPRPGDKMIKGDTTDYQHASIYNSQKDEYSEIDQE